MLLREDAGGYVLVAVVSFAAAVVITALCFRLRNRENQKKTGRTSPLDTNRRRKTNEKRILSILLCLCMAACMLPTVAFAAGAENDKATQLVNTNNPTGGISGYNNSYDYIYMGSYNGSPIKWRVLDTKTNMENATEGDGLFPALRRAAWNRHFRRRVF